MVVEDDKQMSDIIVENVLKQNYSCIAAQKFDDIMDEFTEYDPHLVLLDVNLPFYDGFYWCGKIRMLSKVPIIFISSRNTNMDIIISINMGGDDYIAKPFSIDLLTSKIAGALRRTYSYNNVELDLISHKGLIFNIRENTIFFNGNSTELTKNEAQILGILLKNRGNIVSRERIMRSLWKSSNFIDDNTLTVNITRLRKKLEDLGLDCYIKTKRNQGYMV